MLPANISSHPILVVFRSHQRDTLEALPAGSFLACLSRKIGIYRADCTKSATVFDFDNLVPLDPTAASGPSDPLEKAVKRYRFSWPCGAWGERLKADRVRFEQASSNMNG